VNGAKKNLVANTNVARIRNITGSIHDEAIGFFSNDTILPVALSLWGRLGL
jgi:hypothetical protein